MERLTAAQRSSRISFPYASLAFGISLALLASGGQASTTATVSNCFDAGAGSLRSAIAAAPESGTVSMTALTTSNDGCAASTITLTTGDIVVAQRNLTIVGPTGMNLAVTGKDALGNVEPKRILTHNAGGSGTLTVDNLTLDHGKVLGSSSALGSALGGCLYSLHNIRLNHVRLQNCSVEAPGGGATAFGGALWALGDITVTSSAVESNTAYSDGGTARGGGIFASHNLTIRDSVISYNSASGELAEGGGLHAHGPTVYLGSSTINGNVSSGSAGGAVLNARNVAGGTTTIVDSTISGNTAQFGIVGGAYSYAVSVNVFNSTVAFNHALNGSIYHHYGAGFAALKNGYTNGAPSVATFESSLFSNNTYGAGTPSDLSFSEVNAQSPITIAGHNNLVYVTKSDVPPDTIVGLCPRIGSLSFNGGSKPTHALRSGSPAIDAGNNKRALPFDERGSPFARAVAPTADIGAYEVQQADVVFDADMEGCP